MHHMTGDSVTHGVKSQSVAPRGLRPMLGRERPEGNAVLGVLSWPSKKQPGMRNIITDDLIMISRWLTISSVEVLGWSFRAEASEMVVMASTKPATFARSRGSGGLSLIVECSE